MRGDSGFAIPRPPAVPSILDEWSAIRKLSRNGVLGRCGDGPEQSFTTYFFPVGDELREGIGFTQRLSATGTVRLQAITMLTLEPERLKNRLATTRRRSPEMEGLFTRDAQAACDFSLSASKFSPFFQRVSAMAAILRASVRRAMVGLMPLASDLW